MAQIATFGGGGPGYGSQDAPRDSFASLTFRFVDPTNGSAIDPQDPTVRLTQDGQPVGLQALGASERSDRSYSLTQLAVGLWRFSFMTGVMRPGLYQAEASGLATLSDASQKRIVVQGTVGIGEISLVDDMLSRVRFALFDDDLRVRQYQLDQPIRQFSTEEIYAAMRDAVGELNTTGPRVSYYTLDNLPPGLCHLVVRGATGLVLIGRARFEKANEFQLSDQHTLTIQRADAYDRMGRATYKDFVDAVTRWKKATPPRSIGLGAQRMPFRLTRVIGLLPSMSTFFNS